MKKNIIKMRVCVGFDCNPRMEAISYEDEVLDGRVYQSTKGIRNEKTLVSLGTIWLKFDNASKTPFWDAYAIVDNDTATKESLDEIGRKLFETAIEAVKKSEKDFVERASKMVAPADIAGIIEGQLNGTCISNGEIYHVISVDEFKNAIRAFAKLKGTEMAEKLGKNTDDWDVFFEKTLTMEILDLLMKGLPVLKVVGENILFQSEEMKNNAISVVITKVTNDVFARFMETHI